MILPPRRVPFFVLDAFTDTPFAGNPAGVFLDDQARLSDGAMRSLAAELSLESAFVLPARDASAADLRLRYFTSVMEVPLCGHATVAAITALAHAKKVTKNGTVRAETNVGVLRVEVEQQSDGGVNVTLFQNPPTFGTVLAASAQLLVADALGCAVQEIAATNLPVQAVSTGSPWLLVPVAGRAVVDQAPGDLAAIAALSRRHETLGVYVFAIEENATWGRCFAPLAGLNEDPVTGSAAGALGAYLAHHSVLPGAQGTFTARQGYAGGRGGNVRVSVGEAGVSVTGAATLVAEGTFTLF